MSKTPETDRLLEQLSGPLHETVPHVVKKCRELELRNATLRDGVSCALRRLKNIDPEWAVGAATTVLERTLKS